MKTKKDLKNINDIASKHLGRTSDGNLVKAYETPTQVDPSLLVGVPRSLNRDDNKIDPDIFVGHDVWYCYEFSTLEAETKSPLNFIVRITYPSDSPNIVESKSLKLYLNSYNNATIANENPLFTIKDQIKYNIYKDLVSVLKTNAIEVSIYTLIEASNHFMKGDTYSKGFTDITNTIIKEDISYDVKGIRDPSLLRVQAGDYNNKQFIKYANLRSNCRVTNQPDWGCVYIYLNTSSQYIPPTSIAAYIRSLRNENHFHEEICELIYKDICSVVHVKELFVGCCYTRRGGIDINPMRASDKGTLENNSIFNKPGLRVPFQ